ncbi:LETM1 domain-containing protein 1 [Coturnix japonica]|uniref:LETM1 domain-containing protein 1 n=1 Tax=Coturnix japonica TaxID=93934 RepID=UPI0007770181|nr:LETM1 domain-containing protein 1 [Coturnix japonica]
MSGPALGTAGSYRPARTSPGRRLRPDTRRNRSRSGLHSKMASPCPSATSAFPHVTAALPLPVTCPAAKMALCRVGRCGALRPSGPAPPVLKALRPPPLLPVPIRAVSRWALGARWLRSRYERFLQRSFPRIYTLHCTFTAGLEALLADAREVRRIRQTMAKKGLSSSQLNYRDMERLRQFRRDVLQAVPVALIAIPPFANFLVLLLIPHPIPSHPIVSPPSLPAVPQRALSRVLFLTPLLPTILVRRRLLSHLLEIRHLDRALAQLGLAQLSEEELRAACYLRGLNPARLSTAQCRAWLEQWLGLSCVLQASESSLLANSMVLLTLNYTGAEQR